MAKGQIDGFHDLAVSENLLYDLGYIFQNYSIQEECVYISLYSYTCNKYPFIYIIYIYISIHIHNIYLFIYI